MSTFDAPLLTDADLREALTFADAIECPQDGMPSRWIRALVATVEYERAELDQQRMRAEVAEAELELYRQFERKLTARLEDEGRRAS